MIVLMDENVSFSFTKILRETIREQRFITTQAAGWTGDSLEMQELNPVQKDAELCKLAQENGYGVFITTDRGFEHQQDLKHLPLDVVALDTGREPPITENLEKIIPALEEKLEEIAAAKERGEAPAFHKVSLEKEIKKDKGEESQPLQKEENIPQDKEQEKPAPAPEPEKARDTYQQREFYGTPTTEKEKTHERER